MKRPQRAGCGVRNTPNKRCQPCVTKSFAWRTCVVFLQPYRFGGRASNREHIIAARATASLPHGRHSGQSWCRGRAHLYRPITEGSTVMSIRPVKRIAQSQPTIEGAGVKLRRAFGFGDTVEFDPFLLLDDF